MHLKCVGIIWFELDVLFYAKGEEVREGGRGGTGGRDGRGGSGVLTVCAAANVLNN
jgi:hypothetical protein